MNNAVELTGQERAGLVAWHLAKGERLTVDQAARLTGLSDNGAYSLLLRLSRTLPIVPDEAGTWQNCNHVSEIGHPPEKSRGAGDIMKMSSRRVI